MEFGDAAARGTAKLQSQKTGGICPAKTFALVTDASDPGEERLPEMGVMFDVRFLAHHAPVRAEQVTE